MEVTPTPTPTTEPKSGWNTLSKNAKIAIGIAVVVVILVVAAVSGGNNNNNGNGNSTSSTQDTTPTTQSLSSQWSDWKANFQPIFSQFRSDYTTTTADLNNGDASAATSDFSTLSQDATNLDSASNSPDVATTQAVQQLANDVQTLSSEGITSISNIQSGGSMTQGFSDASTAVGNDITNLNTALSNANNTL